MATRKGFVWDTVSRSDPGNVSPETSDYANVEDDGVLVNGTFDVDLIELTPETDYFFRAFGYDDVAGVYSYGTETGFTTLKLVRQFKLGTTSGVKILSWGAKIEKNDSRKPNILKFGTTQNSAYTLGDEVNYYDLDLNYIFGGEIQKITDGTGVQTIEVADYSVKATQIKANEVYRAELIEDLIADLISTYTDWTLVSNITTGVSIDMTFRDEWLSDSFNKVLDLVNATLEVDKNKDVRIFFMDSTSSGKSLAHSVDTLDGGWQTDNALKAEKVIVKGAYIDQRTSETLTGTGTVFYTAYTPENLDITGFQQTTSTIDGDYVVDKENKKITFDSSQTDPVANYTYKSQIRVETGEGKTVLLEKKYLETRSEARKLAREYASRFAEGGVSAKWIKNSSDIDSYRIGNTISVTDDVNNKTGTYTLNKVTLELPKKLIVEIGLQEQDLFDQNKETIERIKQLEQVNQNQDFITKDDFLSQKLSVSMAATITELKGIINDGAILWASETALASDGDLISDTGLDADYALAYDDDGIPASKIIDYLA